MERRRRLGEVGEVSFEQEIVDVNSGARRTSKDNGIRGRVLELCYERDLVVIWDTLMGTVAYTEGHLSNGLLQLCRAL